MADTILIFVGGEIENTDAVCNYLDHEMKSSPMVDRLAKYKQMLWSHRCVLFKDFKYMTRSARAPSWQWEDRTVHGVDIRYEHVSIQMLGLLIPNGSQITKLTLTRTCVRIPGGCHERSSPSRSRSPPRLRHLQHVSRWFCQCCRSP